MLRTKLPLLALALSAFVITSCGPAQQADTASAPAAKQGQAYVVDETSKPNILQIAAGSDDHTTLVAAVEAAELE
ncbi:MAG: fasciclin domain-containing protein, partial [Rhodothermia bacterium]|nr:fasciclin domain-containing protein [Rhodothermia bacterium]